MDSGPDDHTYSLEPGASVDLSLRVDHGQFVVLDRSAEIDLDAYDAASQQLGLAPFDGGVVIFCESSWSIGTPLRIRLFERKPAIDASAHDHVVLGGLACPSGQLQIFSPEETGVGERTIRVRPGTYGLVLLRRRFRRS